MASGEYLFFRWDIVFIGFSLNISYIIILFISEQVYKFKGLSPVERRETGVGLVKEFGYDRFYGGRTETIDFKTSHGKQRGDF